MLRSCQRPSPSTGAGSPVEGRDVATYLPSWGVRTPETRTCTTWLTVTSGQSRTRRRYRVRTETTGFFTVTTAEACNPASTASSRRWTFEKRATNDHRLHRARSGERLQRSVRNKGRSRELPGPPAARQSSQGMVRAWAHPAHRPEHDEMIRLAFIIAVALALSSCALAGAAGRQADRGGVGEPARVRDEQST